MKNVSIIYNIYIYIYIYIYYEKHVTNSLRQIKLANGTFSTHTHTRAHTHTEKEEEEVG